MCNKKTVSWSEVQFIILSYIQTLFIVNTLSFKTTIIVYMYAYLNCFNCAHFLSLDYVLNCEINAFCKHVSIVTE